MPSVKFVKKIRNYGIACFLVPLIAINSCLLIYKLLGDISLYPNFNYNKEKVEIAYNEFSLADTLWNQNITNCPKYMYKTYYITTDNQTIEDIDKNQELISSLHTSNKLKSVILKRGKILNNQCIINYQFLYSLLKKFSSLETILLHAKQNNRGGLIILFLKN